MSSLPRSVCCSIPAIPAIPCFVLPPLRPLSPTLVVDSVAADKYKRKYLLWFGGIVWLIFIALQVYATKEAERDSMRCFLMLCVVLALGGVNNAIVGGPMMALLDDSVEAGYRSDMELYYSVIWNVSSLAGPIVALVLFYTTKNEWTMDEEKVSCRWGARWDRWERKSARKEKFRRERGA